MCPPNLPCPEICDFNHESICTEVQKESALQRKEAENRRNIAFILNAVRRRAYSLRRTQSVFMFFHVGDELLPVLTAQIMTASADMIADCTVVQN